MTKQLMKAQEIFLDRINQICGKFGLNNIMAQLYAILYLSNNALSLDDMSDRLKISKGSTSINIRALERYGAVRKVWVRGSRRDYYEAETDIYRVIMDRMRSMIQRNLSEAEAMINSSYEALNSVNGPAGEEDMANIKVFKQRLDELRNLYKKAQSLFSLFNSGLTTNLLNIKPKSSYKKAVIPQEQ